MAHLGIVTVGQAPRADIASQFAALLPQGTRITLRGCLDGASASDIAAMAPAGGEDVLYTRLADGSDTTIAKRHAIARAPATLDALRGDGAEAILFACTGAFPDGLGGPGVVFPSRLLAGIAAALVPQGRIGLLVPLPAQVTQLPRKWARPGVEVHAEPLIPSSGAQAAEEAAQRLAAHRPDLVVMDCMSYTTIHRDAVRRVAGVPVLLAVTTMARIAAELAG
jgi:protein AroM